MPTRLALVRRKYSTQHNYHSIRKNGHLQCDLWLSFVWVVGVRSVNTTLSLPSGSQSPGSRQCFSRCGDVCHEIHKYAACWGFFCLSYTTIVLLWPFVALAHPALVTRLNAERDLQQLERDSFRWLRHGSSVVLPDWLPTARWKPSPKPCYKPASGPQNSLHQVYLHNGSLRVCPRQGSTATWSAHFAAPQGAPMLCCLRPLTWPFQEPSWCDINAQCTELIILQPLLATNTHIYLRHLLLNSIITIYYIYFIINSII